MSNTPFNSSDFTDKAEAIILENISNEQFGVSELAERMNMSRSSLLRKIKTQTNLSASLFIRHVRLVKGMEMLKQTSLTVAEISYEVGFGNTSYFIKCFREQYGYSPGELRKGVVTEEEETDQPPISSNYKWYAVAAVALIVVVLGILFFNPKKQDTVQLEKSIAVLPFKNESADSLNLYFVNGLMESTLTNLQKIGDLRVVSRTSVTKYRDADKSAPEIADELNVNYLVEGSGQRFGNQVLLNIQLIEAATDRPIWSEQYTREVEDVFALQNEVAKKIANAIKVMVTPAELQQIEKIPTENMEAYDYYLQALEYYHIRSKESLEKAIPLFEKAIEKDGQFALAYADVAISYYFLDSNQKQKQYTEQINNFADKALLYDSKSAESLIAKAFYYMEVEEYDLALPHLEKALEYNPNSSAVVQMLADLYFHVIPNTAKYLEYALKGVQLNIAANDSVSKSYIYLHLANALVQNGFIDEADTYIKKSEDYFANNGYVYLMKAYIQFAKDGKIQDAQKRLLTEWNKDTTRLDILQEVAKFYYFQEKYDSAFYYYEKFANSRQRYGLDIYPQEDGKIAWMYDKHGMHAQAAQFFKAYANYCEKDESIYKSTSLAVKYAYEGKIDQAMDQLKIFATKDNYQYWVLVFLEKDPLLQPLHSHPEFAGIIQKIKDRFWQKQAVLKKLLAQKGLI